MRKARKVPRIHIIDLKGKGWHLSVAASGTVRSVDITDPNRPHATGR
jgi:hypothetical protein